jgi:hypothetical protein
MPEAGILLSRRRDMHIARRRCGMHRLLVGLCVDCIGYVFRTE